jgi:hypothetical protein
MQSNVLNARNLYKSLSSAQTHLVQSTEISTASVCPYLFKLSYPMGVVRSQQDYIVADTVHDIMSLVTNKIILEKWDYKNKNFEEVSRKIHKECSETIDSIIIYKKDWAKGEGREIPSNFDDDVNDRLHGLLIGLSKRIMYKYERPKRAITEITVTNIRNHHEGRIDAVFEFEDGSYGAIDWKVYNLDPVNGSGSEKWQLIANILLLNYRYTGDEDDWTKYNFGSIVYHSNAYIPRPPIKEKTINVVKDARNFSHEVLCGRSPPAIKPQFCPVCDAGSSHACLDCQFYREDSKLAYAGKLPPNYEQIRRTLFKKRYMIMEERAETHRQKFVIGIMMDKLGEQTAISELEKSGIVHTGYELDVENSYHNETCIRLIRNDFNVYLQPRKQVRLIVKEEGIPLLACVSVSGGIKEINGKVLIIDFRTNTLAARAINILSEPISKGQNSPSFKNHLQKNIVIIPDEINLTRRLLEPLHKFHRLAADILIPYDDFGIADHRREGALI